MSKQSAIEKFLSLSDAAKAAEVEHALHAKSRPLTAAERAKWRKVQKSLKANYAKKRGRPVKGDGVKVISLSVEKRLLKRADQFAKRKGMSRAALIAQGLEAVLA